MVESPIEKKVQVVVVYSPSSLHAKERKVASMSLSDVVRLMQRKVYKDANYGIIVMEVLATCLNDSHDILGHATSSTLSGQWRNVLSTA